MAKKATNPQVKSKGLKDPVDEKMSAEKRAMMDEEMKTFDPSSQPAMVEDELTMAEIGAVRETKSAMPHPFDGYQLARDVPVVGELDGKQLKVSATYVVLMKPSEEPEVDLSNMGNTIYVSGLEGGGGSPKTGKEKVVNFPTSHTRVVKDRSGRNTQIVFDREISVSGQTYRCAIVPSHSVRAQILFYFDLDKNRIKPSKKYMLADLKQLDRLLTLYKALNWQQTKFDRRADQFDAAEDGGSAPKNLIVPGDYS